MKAKFITFKSNRDGSVTLFFESGLDKHLLLDLEGKEVEIGEPMTSESEQYTAGIEAGRRGMYDAFKRFLEAESGEQK